MFGPVRRALLVLAIGSFGLGTGEFVALGLLPNIATDLDVSVPKAGYLISAYALGVVIGAPLLTAVSVRLPRKGLLIGLMLALAAGNVLSAVAPTFAALILLRFVSGLPHGAYFGVASVQGANMVAQNRRNSAMAVIFAGLTTANVIGVPLTTFIGQNTSWRVVFLLVAAVEVVAALGILALVPRAARTDPHSPDAPHIKHELRAFANRQIWLSLTISVVGGGALFATFSYITPMMTHVAGYADSSMTGLLVLFGLGMTVGNLIGANLADRFGTTRVIVASLSAEATIATVFFVGSHNKIASAVLIFLFPMAQTSMFPAMQNRIISLAGGAPNLAAASMHSAFNIANSLGAWLGGLTIAAGWGYNSPNLVAVGLGLLGIAIALYAGATAQTTAATVPAGTTAPGEGADTAGRERPQSSLSQH